MLDIPFLLIPPGLSDQEAADRLAADGPNELPSARPRVTLDIVIDVVREPMFLLLIATGAIYLLLGDAHEAIALLGAIFVIVGITVYQERKTERALQALRDLSSPRALVMRGGSTRRIAGREVVRGDILVVSEGDRVAADAHVLSCTNLAVDESLLTGESVPTHKTATAKDAVPTEPPGGDNRPFIYSGTLIIAGEGFAQVHATGAATELGKIGQALRALEIERTPLQDEVERLVRILAAAGLSACALVTIVYGMTRGHWLDGVLAGLTMAISMVPEEFPVVLTIFLALGAWRISRNQVLTRRFPAIESLGAATVLCVDKTGTLTMNRMAIAKMSAGGQTVQVTGFEPQLPREFRDVLGYALLASKRQAVDPMERAFVDLSTQVGIAHEHDHCTFMREYPLSQDLLAVAQAWQTTTRPGFVVATKGAPEAIAELCRMTPDDKQELVRDADTMAHEGLRVLGVAHSHWDGNTLPESAREFPFAFLGLVGLADPVRAGAADAIRECTTAGIRVVMITGDYPGTARTIAKHIDLPGADQLLTGPELSRMNDAELEQRAGSVSIFARMVPEQKLRLVNALKARGEIVAMTGDGVNDGPALKAAHIGIAMGGRGTDVAREAAALVLLDDDFSSIVRAIRLGRRIYNNLRKAMAYVLAIHVPLALASLVPVLLGWPLILLPVHVIFLEMIVDPACSVAFEMEPEESDVMKRPPRNARQALFETPLVVRSLLQGSGASVIVLAIFGAALGQGLTDLDARALAFTTLVTANLALILANRSWTRTILTTWRSPNAALWWLTGSALGMLALVFSVPFLRELFKVAPLHATDLLVCLVGGIAAVVWIEALKLAYPGETRS